LTSGANILASTITPYVTSSVAAGINQNIQKSLQSAGPFGPILSNLGTSVVNQATQGITNAIFGAATPGNPDAPNYIMFPGADENDPDMSNRNSRYTLEDIVFSLKPANQGPQSEGDAQAQNAPTTGTTVTTNQVAGEGNMAGVSDPASPPANYAKQQAMLPDANGGQRAFEATVAPYEDSGFGAADRKYLGANSTEFLQNPESLYSSEDLKALEAAGVPRDQVKYIVKDGDENPWTNTPFNEIRFPVTGYVNKQGQRVKMPVNPVKRPSSGPPLW
jgi:hypothetical protein